MIINLRDKSTELTGMNKSKTKVRKNLESAKNEPLF
jgi:hypothetical protein